MIIDGINYSHANSALMETRDSQLLGPDLQIGEAECVTVEQVRGESLLAARQRAVHYPPAVDPDDALVPGFPPWMMPRSIGT
jgi:hypothetical protein